MTAPLLDRNASSTSHPAPSERLRVLHVINGEHYSGAERVQDLLGMRLGEHGVDVGFACLKLGRFAALRQARNAEMFDISMRSRLDPRPVAALVQIIRKHKYQIVHTHTARSALVGSLAALICRVPHVHHLHSPTSADTTRWGVNRVNMAVEKLSLRRAAIIAVSNSLGDYARQHHLGKGLIQAVPNGVPASATLPSKPTPTDAWTLGTVALFRPRKGLEVLIAAFAELKQRGLPVRLRAVGAFETADYETEIKRYAEQLGVAADIDWTGFTSKVAAEFQKMDLFVLPSLFGEGLPMVILEAMAAGVPVVATQIEGVPEAIRNTVDGLLTPPNDASALAESIASVIQGDVDWQSLRQSAYERQSQQFSDRSMAAGVAGVYRTAQESQVRTKATGKRHAPSSIELMGTRIDNVTMSRAIDLIKQSLDSNHASQVCFVNADCMNITYRNSDYRQVLADADLVFADGIGMKIAGRVMGTPVVDNVNGTDLFPRLCVALASSGKRVFLLGGRPGVADAVARWIATHTPALQVCGTRDGYFQPHESAQIAAQIAESEADLLFVAMGAPRQDLWIHEHLEQTGCRVAIGVGGLFDFFSGSISRAPEWMRVVGLEWFYRMQQEPRRLGKRYLLGNPLFLLRLARERLFGRRAPVLPQRKATTIATESPQDLLPV